jgi:hypothetical protein
MLVQLQQNKEVFHVFQAKAMYTVISLAISALLPGFAVPYTHGEHVRYVQVSTVTDTN